MEDPVQQGEREYHVRQGEGALLALDHSGHREEGHHVHDEVEDPQVEERRSEHAVDFVGKQKKNKYGYQNVSANVVVWLFFTFDRIPFHKAWAKADIACDGAKDELQEVYPHASKEHDARDKRYPLEPDLDPGLDARLGSHVRRQRIRVHFFFSFLLLLRSENHKSHFFLRYEK